MGYALLQGIFEPASPASPTFQADCLLSEPWGSERSLEKEMATLAFLLGMTEQMKTGLANPKLQFPQCYSHQSFGKFFADRAPLFPEDPRRHVGHALPLWRFLQRPRTQLLISSSMSLTGRALTKGIFLQWFRKGQ